MRFYVSALIWLTLICSVFAGGWLFENYLNAPIQAVCRLSTTHLDFGAVQPAIAVTGTVQIENTGTALLRISDVTSTCGCTVAELSQVEVSPGEKATLIIRFVPSGALSSHAAVKLRTNAPASPEKIITIRAVRERAWQLSTSMVTLDVDTTASVESQLELLAPALRMPGNEVFFRLDSPALRVHTKRFQQSVASAEVSVATNGTKVPRSGQLNDVLHISDRTGLLSISVPVIMRKKSRWLTAIPRVLMQSSDAAKQIPLKVYDHLASQGLRVISVAVEGEEPPFSVSRFDEEFRGGESVIQLTAEVESDRHEVPAGRTWKGHLLLTVGMEDPETIEHVSIPVVFVWSA